MGSVKVMPSDVTIPRQRLAKIILSAYIILFFIGLQVMLRSRDELPEIRPSDLPKPYDRTLRLMLNAVDTGQPLNLCDINSLILDPKNPLSKRDRHRCWLRIKQDRRKVFAVISGEVARKYHGAYAATKLYLRLNHDRIFIMRFSDSYRATIETIPLGSVITCSGLLGSKPTDGLYDCRLE